ncbi:GH25 family lysozyme [Blautia obeum]|uniref:GH25 family lysozyme n=1 Tax=Blautia obeum TaxID=40520 RepID=UPI0035699E86
MEIKGIDVSAWQGKIDWKTAADYGMGFAILRITEAGNVVDSQFENNLAGCNKYNIPVGVYKYSYAMTIAEIQREARKVVNTLNGRRIQFPVFLDLEYNNQRSLGSESIHKMADAFREIVEAAGYKFAIYCNVDWYENVICSHLKKYDFWIARYPANDDGWLQERLRPDFGVGWQYSSKAKIPGISGTVDRNVFYKDYSEEIEKKEETTVNKLQEHTKLGDYYANNGGTKPYLEKKSNAYLDDFTKNAGDKNYTKFARDVNNWNQPGCQGQPWCAVYQFWKLVKVFGLTKALQIMGGGFYNCQSVTRHAKQKGTWHSTPKKGALIIFRNGSHIGSVNSYDATYVYTNEGNTSSAPGVVANGGACRNKKYKLTDSAIDGYVWIDYGTTEDQKSTETAVQLSKVPKWVGMVNTAELNVRSWPGKENPTIKKYPYLAQHNLIDVCDTIKAADGSTWYYVRIVNKYYGFVAARYITRV